MVIKNNEYRWCIDIYEMGSSGPFIRDTICANMDTLTIYGK